MLSALLNENFDLLMDAPESVPRMRELILQLAVMGKLVPQDKDDEPASELLHRIQAEKKKLIEAGKIRRLKDLPPIVEDEKPFALPDGWEWVRLAEATHDLGQSKPDKKFKYIDVSSVSAERGISWTELEEIAPASAPSRARKLVREGTVIFSTVRPYLRKIGVIDQQVSELVIASTAFAVLHPHGGLLSEYLLRFLHSRPHIEYVSYHMIGVAYPAINDGKLGMSALPLPPLAEQKRIVEKVDRLMALCDALEKRQQERDSLQISLNGSAFQSLTTSEDKKSFQVNLKRVRDHFDLLVSRPENVKAVRDTILQLAVMGKLVPQDKNEEPASELLKRIKAEKEKLIEEGKIKRPKELPPIAEDEKPFVLPDAWEWVRLGEVATVAMGNSPPGSSYNEIGKGISLVNGPVEFTKERFGKTVVKKYTTAPTVLCSKGDLLVCVRGATTGRINIASVDHCIGRGVAAIKNLLIAPVFLHYFMLKAGNQLLAMGTGTTFPSISYSDIVEFQFPLPPLAEQKRIVEEVDRLMALCDALEDQLALSKKDGRRLLESVVAELAA